MRARKALPALPNLPAFQSSNHHTVFLYGRLFYIVTSASRKGKLHFVDLEGFEHWKSVCTCEAWRWGERPCRHIAACFEAIAKAAGIPEERQEEWTGRLMFLLNMGHSFLEALNSDSITNTYETTTPIDKDGERGLSESLHRELVGSPD
jgi:hypothetical protein